MFGLDFRPVTAMRMPPRIRAMTPVSYLETGVIFCDENVNRLAQFPAECIDLIYLDPPFFSNRQYEVIWGDEAEVRSFEDRWEGGIEAYVAWMRERLMELYRILKPTGSIYLHCDWHATHRLRVLMDAIFQPRNFRNEIAWRRTPFAGSSKALARQFPRSHDSLLFYSNGDNWTWNQPTKPYSNEYLARFKWDDGDGRGPYRKTLLKTYSEETFDRLKADNRLIEPTRQGAKWSYKQYLSESSGTVQVDDVWTDINSINPVARERLGYPTQKPESLLERIISASSNEGDIVLDPFCGCGTTIAVAHRLKRKWIGIDISPTAVGLMKRRMAKLGAEATLIGMPVTPAQLKALKPFEFQNWVIQRMNGTHSARKSGDLGIDGHSFLEHLPIQVKQSEKVGRNVVDNFETAIERDGHAKGFIVAFSFTRDARGEAARVKVEKGVEIELVEIAELLKDVPDLVTPTPEAEQMYRDLLPEARPPKARPSVEELIASDREMPVRA